MKDSNSRMNYRMIDVGEKAVTRRRALATGRFLAKPGTLQRILEGTLPKGDALKLAEIAGIMAAKKTPELLPLCHPLTIDSIRIEWKTLGSSSAPELEVRCEVVCHGKTGVEMEALAGVQAALLCLYDLTKGIDPELEISGVKLLEKEGGKSGQWLAGATPSALFPGMTVGVLTVSDRCSQGETQDLTGPRLREAFESEGASIETHAIVPDEVSAIRQKIQNWTQDLRLSVILVTGGTGLSPRDVTPEAMTPLWKRTIPGFGEMLRQKGMEKTPFAWISRAEAGVVGDSLVFLLPGSKGAVEDGIAILRETLPHLLKMTEGGRHA